MTNIWTMMVTFGIALIVFLILAALRGRKDHSHH